MRENWRLYFAAITAALGAGAGAYFAGNASQSLAMWAVLHQGPNFMREPINAAIALLIYLAWRKWRPIANYSEPKWGQIGVGLVLGFVIGIGLPGLALGAMAGLNLAVIKPPSFFVLIIHGLAEEILVRGVAQREGHTYFGPWGGVILAALCFCGLQVLQGYNGLFEIANSALFGAVLGLLALGRGGIWSAVGAHAGWSWLETAFLGEKGQIVKTSSWLAGQGPDSYGSPLFSLVLLGVLGGQIFLQIRAQKRKEI
jgi:membrane protease YdiL (CAAX protease family)